MYIYLLILGVYCFPTYSQEFLYAPEVAGDGDARIEAVRARKAAAAAARQKAPAPVPSPTPTHVPEKIIERHEHHNTVIKETGVSWMTYFKSMLVALGVGGIGAGAWFKFHHQAPAVVAPQQPATAPQTREIATSPQRSADSANEAHASGQRTPPPQESPAASPYVPYKHNKRSEGLKDLLPPARRGALDFGDSETSSGSASHDTASVSVPPKTPTLKLKPKTGAITLSEDELHRLMRSPQKTNHQAGAQAEAPNVQQQVNSALNSILTMLIDVNPQLAQELLDLVTHSHSQDPQATLQTIYTLIESEADKVQDHEKLAALRAAISYLKTIMSGLDSHVSKLLLIEDALKTYQHHFHSQRLILEQQQLLAEAS